MGWDGIWRLTEPPMNGDQVKLIQAKALRSFGSYAIPRGVQVNGIYDAATAGFIEEYQERKEASGWKPKLPANTTAKRGDCDFATKQALGILPMAPSSGPVPKYVGYPFTGTWGVWNVGPQVMAINRAPNVWVQGIGSNTGAFLNPDPSHSYIEARNEMVAEFMRLALPDPRPKVLSGYSLGADAVTRALLAWPADRRGEITAVIKFGDPGHLPGDGKVGQNSTHGGISGIWTPEWAVERTYSYQISGDMYGDAPGLLPPLYELLTRMEASVDFAKYLFTWLTGIPLDFGSLFTGITAVPSPVGAGLLGLMGGVLGASVPGFGALAPILGLVTGGPVTQTSGPVSLPQMIFNIPAIVISLIAALKFVFTNAHGKYWVDPIFDGMVAEDHAAAVVRRLTT